MTRTLPKVATEMALNVLAYNMKRVMAINPLIKKFYKAHREKAEALGSPPKFTATRPRDGYSGSIGTGYPDHTSP